MIGVNIGANKDSEDRIADYVTGLDTVRITRLSNVYGGDVGSQNFLTEVLRQALLDYLYDSLQTTLRDDPQAIKLFATRRLTSELDGEGFVDAFRSANEELSKAVDGRDAGVDLDQCPHLDRPAAVRGKRRIALFDQRDRLRGGNRDDPADPGAGEIANIAAVHDVLFSVMSRMPAR